MKDITRRLRVLRASAQITQRDIAAKTGIPLSRYWEIENGYREPDGREIGKIARALKVQPEEIVPSQAAGVA